MFFFFSFLFFYFGKGQLYKANADVISNIVLVIKSRPYINAAAQMADTQVKLKNRQSQSNGELTEHYSVGSLNLSLKVYYPMFMSKWVLS